MSTGRFVWYDLMTEKPAEARAFYAALFGWDVQPHAPDYAMLHLDGRPFGGIVGMRAGEGHGNHWIAYLSTDDISETCRRVEAEGGRIFMRHKAPGVGEFAVIADRQGAAISPIQLENEGPPRPPEKGDNHIAWAELHTTDPKDAAAFYGKVFGWPVQSWEGEYLLVGFEHDAGITTGNPHAPPHWLLYVNVADTDATVGKVKELGGQLLFGPRDIPTVGRFAVFADPVGAAFAVMQNFPKSATPA
ncbi:MAG: VOC family protein [Myxococcota bacterium]